MSDRRRNGTKKHRFPKEAVLLLIEDPVTDRTYLATTV